VGDSIVLNSDPGLAKMLSKSLSRFARETVFSLMKQIRRGKLTVIDQGHAFEFGEPNGADSMVAKIYVDDQRFYPQVLLGGSIGAGEAYMAGYWHSEDFTNVVRLIIINRDLFLGLDKGWARVMMPFHNLLHFLRKNTEEGSRKNIAAHYDLGNDFYRLFLDETLTYSCGIFEHDQATLTDASIAKYDRICRKLDVSPKDHLLEIGTGWGGFAIHAAGRYGCRVTTTSISSSQYDLAQERIKAAELEDRVELLLEDYRALAGSYDKLVSIEMIEAVGHQYLGTFLQCCSNLLKPEGMMMLQAITIADYAYEEHKRSVDFIKRYIFPGGCIPSVTAICSSAADETDLRLFHLEDITPHYVTTLQAWRSRFLENVEQVRGLGYPESFIRMWEFYLCYCEAGFAERYLGNVHMLFTKPLCKRPPILPPFVP
jgi:cyclopropane-fatty-acyl-phospholipid synthase